MESMSKLAMYLKERENVDSVENQYGFATYIISGEECYVKDIYIFPAFRNKTQASELANKIAVIAKSEGCKYLTGSVCPEANNSTESLLVLVGYGMKLHSSRDNLIIFKKDIR